MKKTNALVFACAFGSLMSMNAFADDLVCTQKALKGTYIYHLDGQEGGNPYAAAGMEVFDGNGKGITQEVDSDGHAQQITSTYIVNSDCSGEITYSNGDHNHIYTAPDGSGFTFVHDDEAKAGSWYAGDEKRVAKGQVKIAPK